MAKPTTLEQLRMLAERTQAELAERDEKINTLVSTGGEPNVLEGVKVNGTALTIAEKMVDLLIASGSANGTIAVNGVDVAVKGLAALAYKASVSESDLASALQTTINNKAAQSDVAALQNTLDALKEDVDTFFADADLTTNAKDTLKEIQAYMTSDASAASEMTASISKNKTDIANLVDLVGELPDGATSTTVVAYIAEAIAAIGIGDYAKTAEMNTAIADAIANYYTKTESDNKYVAKEDGKGLSTNDYTSDEKTKLANIANRATRVSKSLSNGCITIEDASGTLQTVRVYTEPSDVLHGTWTTDAEVTTMLTEVFGE